MNKLDKKVLSALENNKNNGILSINRDFYRNNLSKKGEL